MIKKYHAQHIHKEMNIALIYPHVLIALLPCAAAAVYYYGILAIMFLFVGMTAYSLFDYLFSQYVRREKYVWDASGLVSGAIFALILPPTVPLLYLIIGVFFASVVVKQCFGGLGSNLFNPAIAARAFLSIAFPSIDEAYTEPIVSRWSVTSLLYGPVDTVSSATPWISQKEHVFELLSGRYPGAIGTTCAIAIIICGVYLVRYGILRVEAPLSYLLVLSLGYWLGKGSQATVFGMFYWIFTGGILFAAVYAMGDYSTTPTTKYGRLIFGAGAAILTLLIRDFGNPNYAVGFAVLAMNITVPILDLYIRPRIYSMPSWFSGRKKADVTILGKEGEQ